MRADLAAFLQEAAKRRLVYGEFDCGLWLADWYVRATGRPDPAAHLRGVGRRDVGHQARVIVRRLGLQRTTTPQDGDIGLISTARGLPAVGAIFGGCWIVLAHEGGLSGPVHVDRCIAWRIP